MKKTLFFIFFILIIISLITIRISNKLLAQEKTSSPSGLEKKQIIKLKEKVASKVAQLIKKNTQGISGFIKDIKNESFFIQNQKKEIFQINIDPVLTKYYQIIDNQIKEVDKKALSKDQYVIIDGVLNDNQIEANAVYIDEYFLIHSGQVIEINKDEYWIKVLTLEKDNLILDIETYTKKSLLNIKNLELEDIGFSKIKEGDTVHFVIKKQGLKPIKRASALRLIVIPQEFFLKE